MSYTGTFYFCLNQNPAAMSQSTLTSSLILFLGWLAYGLLHSALATTRVKKILSPVLEKQGITYRVFYVLIALLSPIPLLVYYWKQEAEPVWAPVYHLQLVGGVLAGLGVALLRKAFSVFDSRLFFGLEQAAEDREEFKTEGLLKRVRHPIYLATLMIFWGWFLFSNSWQNLAFASAGTLYIFIGIYWEEKKLIAQFGQKYLDYKARTPMIFPSIFK